MKGYHGPAIYHYRKLRKVNQEWLAQFLSMSRQNLSDIERNKSKISERHLAIIAEKLQVSMQDIKNFDPEQGAGEMPLSHSPNTDPFALHFQKTDLESLQKSFLLWVAEREAAQRERENFQARPTRRRTGKLILI